MNRKSSPGNAPRPDLPPPTREEITQRAHRIWIEEGRPAGRHLEHWQEAERQLRGDGKPSPLPTRREIEADKRVDGLGGNPA